MTIHHIHTVQTRQEGDRITPIPVEGYGAFCTECGAVYTCDTQEEQQALHEGLTPCPKCGDMHNVCAGPCCILAATQTEKRCKTCEYYEMAGYGQACPCKHADGKCVEHHNT
jgi:hypothetical protein